MELENDRPPKKYAERWWGGITFLGVLWWLLMLVAIGLLIAILVQQSNQASSLSVLSVRQNALEAGGRPAGRSISIAAQLAQNRPVTTRFCATHVYQSLEGRANDTLTLLEAPIAQFTQGAPALYYYDPLDVQLDVELGADISQALSVATRSLFKLSRDVKYMAFTYNITTSYPHFSSVRLQELEFDPQDRSFRAPRTLVLCSNTNPTTSRRCDRRTEDNTYAVHGSSWRPVSAQAPATKQAPSVPHSKTQAPRPRTAVNAADSDEDLYDLIESGDASPSHVDSQKEAIQGLRIYNVVFYRQPGLDRLYSTHAMGTSGIGATAREEVALTLELERC